MSLTEPERRAREAGRASPRDRNPRRQWTHPLRCLGRQHRFPEGRPPRNRRLPLPRMRRSPSGQPDRRHGDLRSNDLPDRVRSGRGQVSSRRDQPGLGLRPRPQELPPRQSRLPHLSDPRGDGSGIRRQELGPAPTITEAARALYPEHSVEAISRSDAGERNLAITPKRVEEVIEETRSQGKKSIIFVTGVPGRGTYYATSVCGCG